MAIVFLEVSEHSAHVIMVLTADGKAANTVIVIVLNDLVGLGSIAQVVLVEDYQLLLLIALDDEVELGVATAVGDAGIPDLHKDIHLMRVLFDQPQGLLHVSRKPVDVVLEVLDDVHSIDPTII
jgi:hypothetical protein